MHTLALLLCLWAADARQELLEADRAFSEAAVRRGLDGWMSFFAPDARLNTPKGIIEGTAALRQHYAGMFSRPGFSVRWKPLFAEASKDGTLGYTLGVADFEWRDEKGETVRREGHYLTVWRKMRDGSWKAVTDMGN